jgi:mercuric reductase
VPSKTLIRAAHAIHAANDASRFAGVSASARLDDWQALVAQKDALVADMRQKKYADILAAYPSVTSIDGPARLGPGRIAVNGAVLKAPKTIIATGARAHLPDIPCLAETPTLTSTEALAMATLPGSLIVMGGGYIGVELAQMFARLGVAVTIVCRSRLLPGAEPELAAALEGVLANEGIVVRKGLAYRSVSGDAAGVVLSVVADGAEESFVAERLLVATGRTPNTGGLGLDELDIRRTAQGGIAVNDYLRTSNDDIYAVGDVTGRDMHVYMAAHAGNRAARNALGGDSHAYDARAMPAVVFTDPQLATVGLTQAQAVGAGLNVKTAILPLDAVPRALAARDTRGLIKLVADKATGKLLGAHVLAPEGGETIQSAAIAIKAGMTAAELGASLFPYLTTVEGLKLAAQAFEKDVSMLSCCAA